eukprot:TRINITY_DN92943_c0_g1_i1.p1 TRINITY_DN92943_c0_g1~~TRINITY_DN92943_c0_g1_i1.p1  ORF type:complete len:807 (+),score=116.92 TRINITY_DN92943_c0_g1_i1:22-2442(+)
MPNSAGEWLRAVHFWRELSATQRFRYVEVTQPLPLDPASGLWHVHDTLWRERSMFQQVKKIVAALILAVRIILNMWSALTTETTLRFHFYDGGYELRLMESDTANATISVGHHDRDEPRGRFCQTVFCWKSDEQQSYCVTKQAWQNLPTISILIPSLEFIVIAFTSLQVFAGFVSHVVLKRSDCLLNFPSWFLVGPRYLGSFSGVKLLRYANPALFKGVFNDVWNFAIGNLGVHTQKTTLNVLCIVVGIVLACAYIAFGVAALCTHMTLLFWVAVQGPELWRPKQILQLVSFVNRLAAVVDIDLLQKETLYLFRFGGADVKWQPEELRKVTAFKELLVAKMLIGKFVRTRRDRALGWICLATFQADDLQMLWLNAENEQKQNSFDSVMREVSERNRRLDPPYWPPEGSDPNFRTNDSLDENMADDSSRTDDFSLAYFLENLSTYKLWNTLKSPIDQLWFYDSTGELRRGGARMAVQPRLEDLRCSIRKLLVEPYSSSKLELAAKLQAEAENLEALGLRGHSVLHENTIDSPVLELPSSVHPHRLQGLCERSQSCQHGGEGNLDSEQPGEHPGMSTVKYKATLSRRSRWKRTFCMESYLIELATKTWSAGTAEENLDLQHLPIQIRSSVVETYAGLKLVQCDTVVQLKRALQALQLSQTLANAQRVVEHRRLFMEELDHITQQLQHCAIQPLNGSRHEHLRRATERFLSRAKSAAVEGLLSDHMEQLKSAYAELSHVGESSGLEMIDSELHYRGKTRSVSDAVPGGRSLWQPLAPPLQEHSSGAPLHWNGEGIETFLNELNSRSQNI